MGDDGIVGFGQASSTGRTTAVLGGLAGEDGLLGTVNTEDVTVREMISKEAALGKIREIESSTTCK